MDRVIEFTTADCRSVDQSFDLSKAVDPLGVSASASRISSTSVLVSDRTLRTSVCACCCEGTDVLHLESHDDQQLIDPFSKLHVIPGRLWQALHNSVDEEDSVIGNPVTFNHLLTLETDS